MKTLALAAVALVAAICFAPVTGQSADEATFLYALCCGLVLGWLSMALFLSPLITGGNRRPNLKE